MKLIQNQQNSLQRVLVIGEQKNDAEKWKNELTSLIHGQVGTNQVKGKGKSKKIQENPYTVETTNPEKILNHFLIAPKISKSHIGLKPEIAPFLGVSYYNNLSFDFQGNKIEEASGYDTNAEFIRFLKQQVATKDFTLFDLVVIDFNILPQYKNKEYKNKLELIRHLKQNSKSVLIIASKAIEKDQIQALLQELKIPLKTTISSSSNLILISDLSLLKKNQILINNDREKNCNYIQKFLIDALHKPEIAKNQFEIDDSDNTMWKLCFPSKEPHDEIKKFIDKYNLKSKYILYNHTLLTSPAKVNCIFDIKRIHQVKERYEIIDSNHPIILWVKDKCFQNPSLLKRRSAIKLSLQKAQSSKSDIKQGKYFYCIICSSVNGIIEKHTLQYQVYDLISDLKFNDEESKKLIEQLAFEGEFFQNAKNNVNSLEKLDDLFKRCKNESQSPRDIAKNQVWQEKQKKQLEQEKEKVINEIEVNIKKMEKFLPDPINHLLNSVKEMVKYILTTNYDKKNQESSEGSCHTNSENGIVGIGLVYVK